MNMRETQTAICINDKTTRDKKVKVLGITEGKEYPVKLCRYPNYYELVNDLGQVETYFMDRFEMVKTPGEKIQEFHNNNKTWFQEAMEQTAEAITTAIKNGAFKISLEGDKMEDKTIKVRCINTLNFKDLTLGKEYLVIEEEPQRYKILNDHESIRRHHKSLFEKVEDVLMVECVDTGLYEDITKEKQYKVIEEERSAYYIYNDYQVGKTYPKNLFKLVEPQKEVKREYALAEIMFIKEGTRFKIDDIEGEYWVENGLLRHETKGAIYVNLDILAAKFIKVEEPKPVSTAEAFKALDEGKIIESVISKDKYKKINGFICAKNLEIYSRISLMYGSELEGQWIIIEGDK